MLSKFPVQHRKNRPQEDRRHGAESKYVAHEDNCRPITTCRTPIGENVRSMCYMVKRLTSNILNISVSNFFLANFLPHHNGTSRQCTLKPRKTHLYFVWLSFNVRIYTMYMIVLPEKEDLGDEVAGAPAEINKKSYQARLGLARVLAKQPGCVEESCKYYNQVIDMAPQVHQSTSSAVLRQFPDPGAFTICYHMALHFFRSTLTDAGLRRPADRSHPIHHHSTDLPTIPLLTRHFRFFNRCPTSR